MSAVIAGLFALGVLAVDAHASGAWTWTPYDLTQETGGQQAIFTPSLITDPNGADQQAVTDSPSGDIIQFGGDGSGTPHAYDVAAESGGADAGAVAATPSAVKDPQSGDFDIFYRTSGDDLDQYDRTSSTFVWNEYNQTSGAGGQQIVSDPSAITPPSGVLTVFAQASGNQMVVFTRTTDPANYAWTATNLTSALGQQVGGNPQGALDGDASYPEVFAESPTGHLVQFYDGSGGWALTDVTNQGGQTISSDPSVVAANGTDNVFALAPGGDLIAFTRAANGSWASQNLTTLTGGPTLSGDPSAIADPSGGFDVFAQGASEHLVEYTGAGASWSAQDLTATAGGPTVGGGVAASVVSGTSNVAVWVTSPADHLIELERTPAPAPAPTVTGTPTGTGTTTVTTPPVPSTTPTPGARPQLRVKVITKWRWAARHSELVWLRIGRVSAHEHLSFTCRGTGQRHRTGCPFQHRHGSDKRAVEAVLKKMRSTRFGVGVEIHMTLSRPGKTAETATFTIRRSKAPAVTR